MEHVVLVDENDNETGTMEKMEAHRRGLLHRAFSVMIFNSTGELLLQKRATNKYHSAGLWTNTCCSHPRPGENIIVAAQRRLKEEMGFETSLTVKDQFIYRVELENGLTEHELDFILLGIYEGPVDINPEEVSDYKFSRLEELQADIIARPDHYTFWFRLILNIWK